jgi:CheY-like chemotaxis protein
MCQTVLCLYDSEEVLKSLEQSLEPGFRLVSATTVLNAVKQMRKSAPDLIVVQLHLKEESCFDFLKIAQSTVSEKEIPMVAVSAGETCDQTIETYLKRVCNYFGCTSYLSSEDFQSGALRFTLSQLMRKSGLAAVAHKVS